MAPGQSCVDLQLANAKTFSLFDRLRARDGFTLRPENIGTGLLTEARQVCDMIGVSVGEEDKFDVQFVAMCKPDHFAGISTCIERGCSVRRRIPNQVRVHSHPVIIGIKLLEPINPFDFGWVPFSSGEFAKSAATERENRRHAQNSCFIEIAVPQLANCLRIDARFFSQRRIGNAQAALRFSDDVAHVVFERNHCGVKRFAGSISWRQRRS